MISYGAGDFGLCPTEQNHPTSFKIISIKQNILK
jgi:hypothetical protein